LEYTEKYSINDEDFAEPFHRIVFGAIYKIYELGAEKITLKNISDFLEARPKSQGVFQSQKGEEWLIKVSENAIPASFDYYYSRLKKMTLLRAYDAIGLDVSDIYDPDNILDAKKRQAQEEYLDNVSLMTIAQKIDDKIDEIKMKFIDEVEGEAQQAGEGIDALFERLAQYPDVGIPLYGPLVNTVTRGARLRKMYLRSAPSGFGKTRSMVADVCNIGCNYIYDELFGWIKNGTSEPVLYITTEQELEEIQTMMVAFLSAVDEEHILNNKYIGDEKERVAKAIELLKTSPIYIVELPDFSLADVENVIKQNIRQNGVKYVFMDYIMSSLKILGEIAGRAGGVKLREDNILFMMSRRLKDIANEYGVFVLSGTQLSNDWRESDTPDQNLLRGAKAIADSIDYGCHLLPPNQKDLEALETILSANTFDKPNMKISIYKNRRGRYKSVYLWAKAEMGTCRIKPMFCTSWDYEIIPMEDLKIIVDDEGAFDND
jgi:replicative DNA helicase